MMKGILRILVTIRNLLNELRSNLSHEEINRIRKKLYKKEVVYNILKEQEQEGSLTNNEKKLLKNIGRYPKNIAKHLKNLKKHFKNYKNINMAYIIYLMNTIKKTILRIIILIHLKRLECFLMSVEVIFCVERQRELEKNSIE